MQTPEELMQHIEKCLSGIEGEPGHEKVVLDCGLGAELIRARDAEIRRDAFEAGYAQGHNDTVEGCTRDMHDAANDYIAAITGEEE